MPSGIGSSSNLFFTIGLYSIAVMIPLFQQKDYYYKRGIVPIYLRTQSAEKISKVHKVGIELRPK